MKLKIDEGFGDQYLPPKSQLEEDRLYKDLLIQFDEYHTRPMFPQKSPRRDNPWAHYPDSLPRVSDTFHPLNQENLHSTFSKETKFLV